MAIDARVIGVAFDKGTSSGRLILEDRPAKGPKSMEGIKGQTHLYFDVAPSWVVELIGEDIWGSSESIMYREQEIADRKGYTKIVFTAKELHGLGRH